ncbi:hypothetical protein JY96_10005 [Aquabacterium sp. NJ1]|nr:hypothetical protein JY96_10005 [Aquabacterium sp. NJ1]
MVVCLHVGATLNRDTYLGPAADLFRQLSSFGDAGVSFFFVLSGFIVTRVHLPDFNQPARLPAYLLKRVARIYPMYWLVFAMTCLSIWLLPTSRNPLPADAATLIKALLLIPQDPAVVGGTGAPVVFVAWTLQYEMVFYLAMALALIQRWLLLLPLGLILLNSLTHSAGDHFIRNFLSNDHIYLFVMGAGLAMLGSRSWRLSATQARMAITAAALAFVALAAWEDLTFPANNRGLSVLLFGGISTVGVLGLTHLEDAGWRPRPDHLLVRLGHASYTLYLIHVAVMSVLGKMVSLLAQHARPFGPAAATTSAILIVAACALVALVVHRHVEQPIMRKLNQAISRWTDTTAHRT